jgi:hypothetical protein
MEQKLHTENSSHEQEYTSSKERKNVRMKLVTLSTPQSYKWVRREIL